VVGKFPTGCTLHYILYNQDEEVASLFDDNNHLYIQNLAPWHIDSSQLWAGYGYIIGTML